MCLLDGCQKGVWVLHGNQLKLKWLKPGDEQVMTAGPWFPVSPLDVDATINFTSPAKVSKKSRTFFTLASGQPLSIACQLLSQDAHSTGPGQHLVLLQAIHIEHQVYDNDAAEAQEESLMDSGESLGNVDLKQNRELQEAIGRLSKEEMMSYGLTEEVRLEIDEKEIIPSVGSL